MNERGGDKTVLLMAGCVLFFLVALCAAGAGMALFGLGGDTTVVPPGPGRTPPPMPGPGEDVLVGCWNAGPQDPGAECYGPTGIYTIQNRRDGIRRGTWRRLGPAEIEVTLRSAVRWQANCASPQTCTFTNESGTFAFQRTARGDVPRP